MVCESNDDDTTKIDFRYMQYSTTHYATYCDKDA